MTVRLSYSDEIRFHARSGLGWEDIIVRMKLSKAHRTLVRQIVLGARNEHQRASQGQSSDVRALPGTDGQEPAAAQAAVRAGPGCVHSLAREPQSHEFQPENEEHLRKWLLCKAGHHTVKTLTLADLTSTEAVVLLQSAFHAAGAYSFVKATAGRVHIFTPESIAFDKLDHKAACKLFDEIGAVVEVEMGIRADDLLKQTEEAA